MWFVFIQILEESLVDVVESALIRQCRPEANRTFLDAPLTTKPRCKPRPHSRDRLSGAPRYKPFALRDRIMRSDDELLRKSFMAHIRVGNASRRAGVFGRYIKSLLRKPFKDVYSHFWMYQVSHDIPAGPVDLYAVGNLALLLKYAGQKPQLVCWQQFCDRRGADCDLIYGLFDHLRFLPHIHDRVRCKGSIVKWLSAHDMQPPIALSVAVPSSPWSASARRFIASACHKIAAHRPCFAKMLLQLSCVYVDGKESVHKAVCNVVGWCNRFSLSTSLPSTLESFQHAASGFDMVRLPINTRWPVDVPYPMQRQSYVNSIQKLAGTLSRLFPQHSFFTGKVPSVRTPKSPLSGLMGALISRLQLLGKHCVFTVED